MFFVKYLTRYCLSLTFILFMHQGGTLIFSFSFCIQFFVYFGVFLAVLVLYFVCFFLLFMYFPFYPYAISFVMHKCFSSSSFQIMLSIFLLLMPLLNGKCFNFLHIVRIKCFYITQDFIVHHCSNKTHKCYNAVSNTLVNFKHLKMLDFVYFL